MVKSQAISLFQPDDSFILETLLFTDIITDDDITMFETGNHLPDEKEKILSTLNIQFTFSQLKDIFHQSYQRKQLGYMRMMGYTNLDQCRRKYYY